MKRFARPLLSLVAMALISACTSVGNGKANVAYETFGTGINHVVVLHDWLGDRDNYDPIHPYLSPDKFTYAFMDVRGYGKSLDIAGNYTADEAARDAVSVADDLGWNRFHIIGHSMTGMVVQKVALDVPGRVISVIATTPVAASGMTLDEGTWNFFTAMVTDREQAGNGLSLLTGGKLSQKWLDFKVDRAMTTSTAEARLAYLDMFVKNDFSDAAAAAKLQTPMLVVLGENDLPFFRPDAVKETFLKWYPNAEVVNVPNAGHYPMQETPPSYASTIESFITKNAEM
jgi:3-oxoadipate enol-lactonase